MMIFLRLSRMQARSKVLSIQEIGVKAKDSKTLFVELENPAPHFLKLISTPAFFPLYGDSEEPVEFNGPFTLAEWKRGEWISLSQNPFYWDAKRIKLGEIKIFTSQNPFFGYEKFCNEEIDLLGDPISPLHPKLLLEKNIQKNLTTKEISRIFWIHCNTRYPPLHHSDLRKALTLSIDRKRLVDNVFIEQIPHCSPLPIKYSYFKGSIEGNTALAESLFKKALCELKLERKAFPTLTILHSDLSFEKALMEELCAQWKEKLNIHVVPKQLPWSEFSLALEKGNFQLGGLFRRDLFNHPLFYLNFFKNTPYNPHGWDNSEYEQLHDRYAYENNSKEILKKLEKLLIREAPVIPLVNQKCLMLIHKRIKGLKWQDNGCLDLTEVWIDENTY
jgi:oligopeptide transport system substrate-binding protein